MKYLKLEKARTNENWGLEPELLGDWKKYKTVMTLPNFGLCVGPGH